MGARQKLNQAFFNGALVAGGVIGLAAGSWTVFLLATLAGIGLSILGGDIRFHHRRPPRR